jgi:ATP-dependent helicase HrpA
MAAMQAHQVIIVCGETGSGKTTQLPKMALALGRGQRPSADDVRGPGKSGSDPKLPRKQIIGHTQPRRIAASSVAKRIAEELKTPLGDVVGFKVRFSDRLGKDACVKLMTDGILLAETQNDPLLKAYDTIIIDEAHERSLNIDFLLGYLREILPRRPDLKIIVTSATIDADRFARHFASMRPAQGRPKAGSAPSGGSDLHEVGERGGMVLCPAPVLMVSGRTFPVEMRYRPFEEKRDYDLNNAIADAVDELWSNPSQQGDILVFLPGEREIREAADHLRVHLSHSPVMRSAEVLPLFARLSVAEQDRVFDTRGGRRIVLATNVAETSLTVPGIRYVIDAGNARVKRYSWRSKVEQLMVEPISQAAANQRAGRCGRVANGICIRLYDEVDFNGRTAYTDPEILRSSLAGVILRMKSLHLGNVEQFPFLEAPRPKAIADGYQLLSELGAVDDDNELTPMGRELSRLPLDPRVGRMILEARERKALDEVLIIAAALSVQDVRDRPMEAQAAADQAHAKFDDDRSEFSGYLNLWKWLENARGGNHNEHKLSNRQYENLLRQNFINVRRVREWRDTHTQLLTVVNEHKWRINTLPASYEQLHLSMLAGLLGNVGCKLDDDEAYLGARGIKFYRHPGAHLRKKPGRWIVVAELVETTRLFGRGIAAMEPQWLEQVGGHLLKKQLLDPHWEKKAGEVKALERATLYGLVVYNGRRVSFSLADPVGAREIFIREALVAGELDTKLPFLAANQKLMTQVEELEHKSRRQDVLVDDALIYAFYDQQLPADVCSLVTLEHWYREEVKRQPQLLLLSREELMRHQAAGITTQAFPKTLRLGGVDCAADYLHEPGDAKDGLTVTVPLFVLNQVSEERAEWLVPGMLNQKIHALLKTLHQRPRSRLVPLLESAARLTEALSADTLFGAGPLVDALLKRVRDATQVDVKRADLKVDMLPPHLFMNFRVVDEHGRQLGHGRNLGALKAELGSQARGAFQALAALKGVGTLLGSGAVVDAGVGVDVAAALSVEGQRAPHALQKSSPAAPHRSTPFGGAASEMGAPISLPEQRYTSWTFGELPELMEITKGKQTIIGFPALVDVGDAVCIEVFDEPEVAATKHRAGLRRLFAMQIKDALKYLEKNLPDLQKMSVVYMMVGKSPDGSGGGTAEELKQQILDVALDRAFLLDPLPTCEADFKRRLDEGRGRLTLIANEIARLASTVLTEFAAASRKVKDTKTCPDSVADTAQQLQRLVGKRFIADTPYTQLQHFARYLKAVVLRLDKLRADPARDATKLAELKPLDQKYWRLVAERKGVTDARMQEFRWLLEELRVSFFAQELRTPQPVSVKRLDKAWQQLSY